MNATATAGWSYADYERALDETIDRAAALEECARRVCRAWSMGYPEALRVELAKPAAMLADLAAESRAVLDSRQVSDG